MLPMSALPMPGPRWVDGGLTLCVVHAGPWLRRRASAATADTDVAAVSAAC
jgi:hypothetical protein